MKKLIFTLVLSVGVLTSVVAQEAGNMWVGGSIGLSHTKKDFNGAETKNTNVKFMPEFGYVLSENLAIGANLGYARFSGGSELMGMDFSDKTDVFEIKPFLRYTFLKGNLGALFFDGGVGYTYAKEKNNDDKMNAFEVGLRPGVAFNVSDKITLTGKFGFLGYQHAKMGDIKSDYYGFDFDFTQFTLGAAYNF